MRVSFADIKGIRTRYIHAGAGYPVMLLHGAGMSADCWLRNIDALARDFAVFAPDVLGQGFTGSGDYPGGPPHPFMVQHLVDFADWLGIDRFVPVGSSFGGLLAGLLYFRLPRRVEGLVFGSSGSVVHHEGDSDLQNAYRNGLSAIENPTPENCRKRLERIFFDPAAVPDELVFMQATLYALPDARESYERRMCGMMQFEACRPYKIVERLEQIEVPTLLIWGRDDPRGRLDRAQEAARRIKGASLVAIERCKHHPHIEHPQRFNALVADFIRPLALRRAVA
ncbi:MAG: alpha/beta hydrolase [Alphaproteobacteria bacterium]|nr:alpha/beta hydrolase [Alphaproteobacteria bacterium]